ncbi:hypothetical protein SAMN04487868_13235 [Marinobacter salarius]|jgi:hypothetical protein|uniref:Uncharacterized protein n=2 Tax=Marinobacter salarius TaxID=1420917 RepID=A0ABY1FUH5_9GAMM|nr:hypothetical protein SAMN04487868_13235 [Marinobacter salarius]|tara:strand:- start:326 stop:484 length:159 start_codon:yes stop_codon:yes gene_type:complete
MWMARWKPTASSGYQATIDSVISGNNGLMKTGEGTLVLENHRVDERTGCVGM